MDQFSDPQAIIVLGTKLYHKRLGNSSTLVSWGHLIYWLISLPVARASILGVYTVVDPVPSVMLNTLSGATLLLGQLGKQRTPILIKWEATFASVLERFCCYTSAKGHCISISPSLDFFDREGVCDEQHWYFLFHCRLICYSRFYSHWSVHSFKISHCTVE